MKQSELNKLGNLIKEKREQQGVTVRELKDKAGLSTTSIISEIENSTKKRIDPLVLKKIAKALDIDYFKLLNLAGFLDDSDYNRLSKTEFNIKNSSGIINNTGTGIINTGTGAIHITVKNGLSNSYNESEIVEMINDLPKDLQKEVFEFISFKHMKYKKSETDS